MIWERIGFNALSVWFGTMNHAQDCMANPQNCYILCATTVNKTLIPRTIIKVTLVGEFGNIMFTNVRLLYPLVFIFNTLVDHFIERKIKDDGYVIIITLKKVYTCFKGVCSDHIWILPSKWSF